MNPAQKKMSGKQKKRVKVVNHLKASSKLKIAKCEPLGDNVLLEVVDKIPEHPICRVLALGRGYPTPIGTIPLPFKKNDVVAVSRYPGQSIILEDKNLFVCRAHQIRLKILKKRGRKAVSCDEKS